MNKEEFSLLFHRAQVNLVAFKMLYEPEAFEAMHRMVEMALADERKACAEIAAWILKMPQNDVSHHILARGNK